MHNLRIAALVAVAVLSTGCFRVTHTLSVKPDGSGTISQTIAMSEAVMKQAGAMMAGQGSSGAIFPTEAKLREDAAGMGEGVRFVSSTPYTAGGFEGVTAVYAFDDLSKLKLNMEKAFTGAVEGPMGGGEKRDPDPKADVTLSFTRENGRTVLVIGLPEVPKSDEISAEAKQQAEATAKQVDDNPAVEAMMKQMLAGMLMEIIVNVEGTILETDAPFVEGSRIVLMRLDMDEALKSGRAASEIMKLGDPPDFEAMLKNVPGLKIVTQRKVRIAFR